MELVGECFSADVMYVAVGVSRWSWLVNVSVLIIIIIIIQHLYSAMVSYAGCRGACGAS